MPYLGSSPDNLGTLPLDGPWKWSNLAIFMLFQGAEDATEVPPYWVPANKRASEPYSKVGRVARDEGSRGRAGQMWVSTTLPWPVPASTHPTACGTTSPHRRPHLTTICLGNIIFLIFLDVHFFFTFQHF